jgi:hypothetical protein
MRAGATVRQIRGIPVPRESDQSAGHIVSVAPIMPASAGAGRVGRRLRDVERADRLIRVATVGVVVSIIVILVQRLGRVVVGTVDWDGVMVAVVATAVLVPAEVGWALWAMRGERRRGRWRVPVVVAAATLGLVPVLGIDWVASIHFLATMALVSLRPPWSFVAFAGIVGTPAPVAYALGHSEEALWLVLATFHGGLALAALIWLVAAIRRLQTLRAAVAEAAVVEERLRIDADVGTALGTALDTIVAAGERAGRAVLRDPAGAARDLDRLVEVARSTMTRARRVIIPYQDPAPAVELNAAVALLSAAGVEVRLVLPRAALPEQFDESVRTSLRAAVADALRADAKRCVLTVTGQGVQTAVELRAGDSSGGDVSGG